ncbi:amidophosphoribosyltransferase [Candidatus Anaplasma sp. TIGMIC]|uniref:amidophosphoribosyltransferase n=1 Tax=Candidatus Anaplasma sp. TIGMIC TaxID=3020713 RepID=UPI00233142E0|nr:amidophosphoribosyltransferase [Candidatus Anaplasma sp. TIGMIC]MDB1135286.1 amidophosphoribosyltransferase [Candidatus Anaplasma sp. TIGMIC]
MPFASVREECGVFAIQNHSNAVHKCLLGLHALQHRGQESFGLAAYTVGSTIPGSFYKSGCVSSVFGNSVVGSLDGNLAVGHVRYSTSGGVTATGTQPFIVDSKFGPLSVAHNGNLTNASSLREDLVKRGCVFTSNIDTEVVAHLIATHDSSTLVDCVSSSIQKVRGAFAFAIVARDTLIGVRDAAGIRPLVLGIVDGAHVLASETCALDIVGAKFVRNIEPGELVAIDKENNIFSVFPFKTEKYSFCIFEYIYFARPDSVVENRPVYETRKNIGATLAAESPPPKNVDMVVPVPDSGIPAAMGYATESGVPFEFGIVRNHYVGRTFIQPSDKARKLGVELKHNANAAILRGKNIVLVDDSIVRGTTLREVIALLRRAGTKNIHLRISSPPTIYSCFYGIDTPTRSKLVANNLSINQLTKMLNCDSLSFISINGLYRAVCGTDRNNTAPQFCDACFTGLYPQGEIE